MKISILGLHPVEDAPEPCHLIELLIDGGGSELDFSAITQEDPGRPDSDWQVPYDEHLLDEDGTRGEPLEIPDLPDTARVAFFIHHLDPHRPLLTPAGPLALPGETPTPDRLKFMRYEEP